MHNPVSDPDKIFINHNIYFMQNVLVTGATGFLGFNLCKMLLEQKAVVTVLARSKANLQDLKASGCRVLYGDLTSYADIDIAVKGQDIVIHAASITQQYGVSFEEYERINVVPTRLIAEACLRYGVKKLIYVSTANTIGAGTISRPGTELNGFSYFRARSGYINSKYLAQQYILEQVSSRGLPAVVVNPTFIIGPRDVKPSSGQMILYGLNKKLLFYPPGGKNFVHVDDVCSGIIRAIAQGRIGDCYLLAGENLSYRDFFKLLARIQKQKTRLLRIPGWALRTGGWAGTIFQRLSGRPSPLNYTTSYLLCAGNYYSGQKSSKAFQLEYQPVETALREALHWFKGRGIIGDRTDRAIRNVP